MSEYQYYEFRAIDEPLTSQQMAQLRRVSTRAEITRTSFTNVYNFGDFRGNPSTLMERYFDAFLYFANWGTHRLAFRLPQSALDLATARRYCRSDAATATAVRGFLVLDFEASSEERGLPPDEDDETEEAEMEDEEATEEDGEAGWEGDDADRLERPGELDSLLPLRADLAAGDLRCLYLVWLQCVQSGQVGDGEPEPQCPAGLATLTAPLEAFRRFLFIDRDLVAAAAAASPALDKSAARRNLENLVAGLSASEKNALLVRLGTATNDDVRGELLRRAHADADAARRAPAARTVGQLLASARRLAAERRRRAAENAARRRQRAAAARERHLADLTAREPLVWKEIDLLIASKEQPSYDRAATLLRDLQEIARRADREAGYADRLVELRRRHATKQSMWRRLKSRKW